MAPPLAAAAVVVAAPTAAAAAAKKVMAAAAAMVVVRRAVMLLLPLLPLLVPIGRCCRDRPPNNDMSATGPLGGTGRLGVRTNG